MTVSGSGLVLKYTTTYRVNSMLTREQPETPLSQSYECWCLCYWCQQIFSPSMTDTEMETNKGSCKQWNGWSSYLCSPHGRCTFWQSWALMCSPAGSDWSDCSQTPGLWTTKHTLVSNCPADTLTAKTYSNSGTHPCVGYNPKHCSCLCFTRSEYLWCSLCLGQPDRWADESGTSWASSWFSSGLMSPYSQMFSSLRKTSRTWVGSRL